MLCCYPGQKVKTSHHVNATLYVVKKVDTLHDKCYIVPCDGSYCGEWYSSNALIPVKA